jgi:hypothetical protein
MSEEAHVPFAPLKRRDKTRLPTPHPTTEHRVVFEHPNVPKTVVTSIAQNLQMG